MTLQPPSASLVVTAGIAGLSVAMLFAWATLARRLEPERAAGFAAGLSAWALGWLGLAAAGVFARVDARPPPFLLLPVGLVVGVALVARSRLGAALASAPLWWLVGLQAFRLPLELVMHQAALEGTMPAQMTFSEVAGRAGLNFDIVTGATAVVLALVLRSRTVPRALVLGWNALGMLLLLNVVAIGVSSTPMFARFGSAPEALNTWVLFAPFIWLPAVLVGSALLGHVLVFRALLGRANATATATAPAIPATRRSNGKGPGEQP